MRKVVLSGSLAMNNQQRLRGFAATTLGARGGFASKRGAAVLIAAVDGVYPFRAIEDCRAAFARCMLCACLSHGLSINAADGLLVSFLGCESSGGNAYSCAAFTGFCLVAWHLG